MKLKQFKQSLTLAFALGSISIFAENDKEKLKEFYRKPLQISVIKNPGNILKGGLFNLSLNEEIIIVRSSNGKIINTYITSAARPEKYTPSGVFLEILRANENHASDIYGTEMDWALFVSEHIAIHSTTEDVYGMLGSPASAGCLRLLREDARELFQYVTGQIKTPITGVKLNYVKNKKVGVYIVADEDIPAYWNSFSNKDKAEIIKLAKINRRKINKHIKDFNQNGDIKDDEHEDTFQVPLATQQR